MASSMVHSSKHMKRTESRKSHSWWWDSHISPKNSKWFAENLEEMDQSVKQMMKLIEDDGDSFAKKAEMYYKKRPELISHVEDFYRMYRSLAERYDHVTGELRKNIPSDLQSQGSGISDAGLELLSTPDNRLGRRRSSHRAAGFDFFLGSGGNSSDVYQKEGDESSTLTDSEPESDDSSVNNYPFLLGNGGDQGLSRKIVELEIELREMKEKFRMQQEGNADGSFREAKNEIPEDFPARIAHYEQELRIANGKISQSEEEIARLKIEIQKYKSLEFGNDSQSEHGSSAQEEVKMQEAELEADLALGIQQRVGQTENGKIQALVEELRINKEKLRESGKEIARLKHDLESNKSSENTRHLQDQIELAHKEIVTWKTKLNVEKRQVSKLQERILRLKASLSDRDHEVRDLKIAVSDAEQKIFPEKSNLKAEMSKMLEERTRLEEELREWESRARLLEDEIRKVQAGKTEIEIRLTGEIEQFKAEIVDRGDRIEILNKSLDGLKLERDELNAKALTLTAEISSRDEQINQMDKHLQQYHKEHVELIAGIEGANKLAEELRSRAEELEAEVERQRVVISEGAEEKREAIRQLCFSLEHYRNGYHMLRQAFIGQKRVPVLAS